jgi:hypothetical protein
MVELEPCEAHGVRYVFPTTMGINRSCDPDGWLLVSHWVLDELARAGAGEVKR